MTTCTKLYTKTFSKIEKLQENENIYYNLISSNNNNITSYGIEVSSKSNGKEEKLSLDCLSEDIDLINNIIKYLYENSIKPEASLGIINDILNVIQ